MKPELKVLYNSPYPGNTDGLASYLRKHYDATQYAGFELEVNQKFFLTGEPETWTELVKVLTQALKETNDQFARDHKK